MRSHHHVCRVLREVCRGLDGRRHSLLLVAGTPCVERHVAGGVDLVMIVDKTEQKKFWASRGSSEQFQATPGMP